MTKRESSSPAGVVAMAAVGMVVCCGITTLVTAGALGALGGWLTGNAVVGVGLVLALVVAWVALHRRRKGCAVPEREPTASDESSRPR